MNLSVIGLGKLGSPLAACLAARGHRVIGVDRNESYVQAINEGEPPVFEPGLKEMLQQARGRLSATTEISSAVVESDMTFLVVATPTEPGGAFSLKYVLSAAQAVGQAIRKKESYHLVALTSTVMPGSTGGPVKTALEKASGRRCVDDFGLCYNPEFISLGSVIRDFLNPDFVLIGESDPRSGDLLAGLYREVCDHAPPLARMSWNNAELTKLALNAYVTTKISYANMLAQLCERLEGGDVDAVTSALGLDSRIGAKYLKGALGYGGPCFPRDNHALIRLAQDLGVSAPLPVATERINQQQGPRLAELVRFWLPADGCVGILGLAYKPGTNVVERSQGLELAQTLLAEEIPVIVHDPCALDAAHKVLRGPVSFADSPGECARRADVLVVCLPCPEFKTITAEDLSRSGNPLTVIDCWRILDRRHISSTCHYVALGTSDVARARTDGVTGRQVVPAVPGECH